MGDSDGMVQLFTMKKGEVQLGFKTLPGKPITRIELGGALGKYICLIIKLNIT